MLLTSARFSELFRTHQPRKLTPNLNHLPRNLTPNLNHLPRNLTPSRFHARCTCGLTAVCGARLHAHRTPHAYRPPQTAPNTHRTPHTAHHTPHTAPHAHRTPERTDDGVRFACGAVSEQKGPKKEKGQKEEAVVKIEDKNKVFTLWGLAPQILTLIPPP